MDFDLLDLVNVNVYLQFDQNPLIHSEDYKQRHNSDLNQGSQLCWTLMYLAHF